MILCLLGTAGLSWGVFAANVGTATPGVITPGAGVPGVPLGTSTPGSTAGSGEEVRYSRKVVSVLYDDSGSMLKSVGDTTRAEYAYYGLQVLMAVMNAGDRLMVTPMTDRSMSIDLTLSETDRTGQIETALKGTDGLRNPPGGHLTPVKSIAAAMEKLTQAGMNDPAKDDGTVEYWFVLLTDGQFNELKSEVELADRLSAYLGKSAAFHMIYFGISDQAWKLLPQDMNNDPAFTGHHAGDGMETVKAMQAIGDQLSGRFALDDSLVHRNGNKLTVDLSFDFAIRSLSVVAQNAGATVTSAVYRDTNGEEPLSISSLCTIPASRALGLGQGFTGSFARESGTFGGGQLELTFDQALNRDVSLSVTASPGLYVDAFFLYEEGGTWKEGDRNYISSNMAPGARVKVGYRLLEEGSHREIALSSLPGASSAGVSFGGSNHTLDEALPLQLGQNDFLLSLSLLDRKLSLFSPLRCYIQDNPTFFRVEGSLNDRVDGDPHRNEGVFTVYFENKPLNKKDLAAFQVAVSGRTPAGEAMDLSYTAGADGKLSVPLDLAGKAYGVYTLQVSVTSEKGVTRQAELSVPHYPDALTLTPDGGNSMSFTAHGLKNNTTSLAFVLTMTGNEPLAFDNGLVTVSLTRDGTALPASAYRLEGNRLIFTPDAANIPVPAEGGTVTLTASVHCAARPELDTSASFTVEVKPSSYVILPVDTGCTSVGCFDIADRTASVAFAVKRDGEYIPKEELETLWQEGKITLTSKEVEAFLAPMNGEITADAIDGVPVLRYRLIEGHGGILRFFFTSKLTARGEKTVTASLTGISNTADARAVLTVEKGSAAGYIWRGLLWVFLIWLILWLVTLPFVTRVQPMVMVKITLSGSVRINAKPINLSKRQQFRKKRILPLPYHKDVIQNKEVARVTLTAKGKAGSASTTLRFNETAPVFLFDNARVNGSYVSILRTLRQKVDKEFIKSNNRLIGKLFGKYTTRRINDTQITEDFLTAAFPYFVENDNTADAGNVKRREEKVRYDTYYVTYQSDGRSQRPKNVIFFVKAPLRWTNIFRKD